MQNPGINNSVPWKLLPQPMQKGNYGSIIENQDQKILKPKLSYTKPKSFWAKLKQILPYIWPKNNFLLQLNFFACFLLLAAGRGVNLFIPIYNKYIVDDLAMTSTGSGTVVVTVQPSIWISVAIWLGLQLLQGGVGGTSGLLRSTSNYLWTYIKQFAAREVEINFFHQLHTLGSRWHYQRQTGQVIRALDRGSIAMSSILQMLVFTVIPAIADVAIAIVYFATLFNYIFALIIGIFSIIFIYTTYVFSQWRSTYIRAMNDFDNKKRQMGVDSLLNSDTVKEYVNEDYERERYTVMMRGFQNKQIMFTFINSITDLIQSLILTLGFGLGVSLCVFMVLKHEEGFTTGDYVLFSTYMIQVFDPLYTCGTFYRSFVQVFVDMENMFEIFHLQPEIIDSPFAIPFTVDRGEVEFKNVSFGYSPDKIVLNNISFKVPAGQTLAIVGASGGGKTTIVKLLLRFFEAGSGEILVDGKSIRDMTIRSLRHQIGVVPQDTILFNETIKYNINYGRPSASIFEVIEAASAACIHDKILSFPEQYETLVGERGMKVSGGEKQRVAIARLILKNPKIIILDEATSALDTRTERSIQSALTILSQNRTCIVVAHRLSTVVNANCILVLQGGRILEKGTHTELMAINGTYAEMWEAQYRVENEVEEPTSSDQSTQQSTTDLLNLS